MSLDELEKFCTACLMDDCGSCDGGRCQCEHPS